MNQNNTQSKTFEPNEQVSVQLGNSTYLGTIIKRVTGIHYWVRIKNTEECVHYSKINKLN